MIKNRENGPVPSSGLTGFPLSLWSMYIDLWAPSWADQRQRGRLTVRIRAIRSTTQISFIGRSGNDQPPMVLSSSAINVLS